MSCNMSNGFNPNQVSPASNQMSPMNNQLSPIVTEPTMLYNNVFHPQAQPIIHPVEVINQHHVVPVPQHYTTCSVKDVWCSGRSSRNSRSMRSSRSSKRR
ncbi:hypothetical protein PA598K_04640 [Paenibacillus sp. 598K]|uniref:hypothetical protein n=1 Tax=Paenibacillus sp. 598K TaxID=1117987 RepID=UPI000FF9FFA6|nr:hypothetical protein [Paenibacillus sp. 598K]GBF76190.1 hypothetical protein PA598K_04640 [Paenibacillus sp. 598K]